MLKMYEALITPYEGGYEVEFPDVPGCVTQGDNLEDAYTMAYDALGLMLQELSESGREFPAASFGREVPESGVVSVFAINTNALDFTEKYVTVSQASDMLGGLSHQRVHALVKSGDLVSERVGSSRLIDQQSVIDYRNRRKGAGRPRKISASA